MASPFQRYQSGIEASTGNLVPAYGQMGQQTANAIAGFGQNLAEGIKAYNDNSAKSEAANAKIQMLSQAYADKIAMYSKDPEIAQSGILDSLMSKAKMLQEAPTKGLSQRVMLAHEAETSLAGFGNQLQEWSFLRGREMERATQEGLSRLAGFKSVTTPQFVKDGEFRINPNIPLVEQEAQVRAKFQKIKALNPAMEGTEQEFMSAWRAQAEQDMAKADPNKVPPTVVNSFLEQLNAQKRLSKVGGGTMADMENIATTAAADVLRPSVPAPAAVAAGATPQQVSKASQANILSPQEIKKTKEEIKNLQDEIRLKFGVLGVTTSPNRAKQKQELQNKINDLNAKIALSERPAGNAQGTSAPVSMQALGSETEAKLAELKRQETALTQQIAKQKENSFFAPQTTPVERTLTNIGGLLQDFATSRGQLMSDTGNKLGVLSSGMSMSPTGAFLAEMGWLDTRSQAQKNIDNANIQKQLGTAVVNTPEKELASVKEQIRLLTPVAKEAKKAVAAQTPQAQKAPTVAEIPMGEMVAGRITEEKPISVLERQQQVADFITQKMGAIDPTDPERKRRLPVTGFDKFYKSLVPEAEIREYTTPSGIRMMYANGKWDQVKFDTAKPMTPAEIRKANVGVFGQQTEDGRLIPTEFVPDSGVYVGGLFKGSDAAVDKFQEELPRLIDARRGVKRLAAINDRVGEFFSPEAQGEAEVEVMNLSAMLRTDIIGVGTVSNYEQELIKKVIRNPTDFFNLESKDRAILLALGQRVDRRIKNLSAAHGLTTIIKDDKGSNKYEALRMQYLKEKGILK